MKYAGFWKRFVAAVIDLLILIIPIFALNWALPFAGSLILCILYYPVFESSPLQATPGKYWMGLKVLGENGQTLSFPRAVARFLLKYVSSALLLLGYVLQLFTAKRQTLHDLIVNAVVIDEVSSGSPDWIDAWMKNMRKILKTDQSVIDVEATSSTSSSTSTTTSPSASAVESIEKLHELYKNGVLTEEEFQNKKAELLKQV